jgi:hypothetical protein
MWLAVVLAAVYLIWFAWPLWWSGSESARLVGAFNVDEEAHLLLLKEAIEHRTVRLGYYYYGYAFLNMGLLPLLVLSLFSPITEQHIIVWLRMIPTAFAVATVAMTFYLARRYLGRLAAWLSALLLSVTVLHFLRMSVMSHSDIPQLFFLLLGVYWCCRFLEDRQVSGWIGASAAAGVAFSCKYSGLFLLPVIGLCGVLHIGRLDTAQVRVDSDRVAQGARLLAALLALGLFVVGSVVVPRAAAPYASAEYYGVSMPDFFRALRGLALAASAILVLLAAVPAVWTFIRDRPTLALLLQLGMLSAATFALAVVLTSPFHIFDVRSGVLRGFLYESLHGSFGHGMRAQTDRLQWLTLLASPQLLHPLVLALAALGLALWAYRLDRVGSQGLLDPRLVIWVWTAGYLGLLLWRVNVRTHRALLPVIPFLLTLAAGAVHQIKHCAATRLPRRVVSLLTIAGLLVLLVVVLPPSVHRLLQFRQSTASREQSSKAVEAGKWLEAHLPPSTRVLYDPHSYVPPTFADAHVTPWGGTPQLLETLQPDVVIVHSQQSDTFSDPGQAGDYVREEAQYLARYEYYASLRSGEAGYALLRAFGSVQVYGRRGD